MQFKKYRALIYADADADAVPNVRLGE